MDGFTRVFVIGSQLCLTHSARVSRSGATYSPELQIADDLRPLDLGRPAGREAAVPLLLSPLVLIESGIDHHVPAGRLLAGGVGADSLVDVPPSSRHPQPLEQGGNGDDDPPSEPAGGELATTSCLIRSRPSEPAPLRSARPRSSPGWPARRVPSAYAPSCRDLLRRSRPGPGVFAHRRGRLW